MSRDVPLHLDDPLGVSGWLARLARALRNHSPVGGHIGNPHGFTGPFDKNALICACVPPYSSVSYHAAFPRHIEMTFQFATLFFVRSARVAMGRSMLPPLIATAMLLASPRLVFGAESVPASTRAHEITAGMATSFFQGHRDSTLTAWTVDVAYHYRPQKIESLQNVRFTGGLRGGWIPDADGAVFDVYVRADMVGHIGAWAPTLGPELGFTSLGTGFFRYPAPFPDDLTVLNENKLSPLYLAFVVTPIRFGFSRFTLSVMELSLGAPILGVGSITRFQLGVFSFGGTL